MAILEILHFPDKRLRTKAKAVENVNDEIRQIVDDMFETMYKSFGIGLAATQVNIHQRIIAIDVSDSKNQPLCLINPQLIQTVGVEQMDEGCLSVPGVCETVERAERVTVSALNAQGETFSLEAGDLLAVCIQHEMDHLEGKLFVDYLSPLKRQRIKSKLLKRKHS